MRQVCLKMVHELARKDERVVFVGSDLGVGTLAAFRDEFPERFIMEGVSEASILGLAAGLAFEGHIVYVNTLAVFLTRRAFEQAAMDIALHQLNVRLIGNGGGLVYAPLGPTHMAVEDIALMRAVPNMAIVAPADALEMRRIMPLVHEHQGPVYIRLAKGNDPVVTKEDTPLAFGKPVPVRAGGDALLITTGITLKVAMDAAALLAPKGIQAAILHCPTVWPLDHEALRDAINPVPTVLTIEEHVRSGGLGSAVAELIAETRWPQTKRFKRIALPDEYPSRYGSQADLLEHYGITAAQAAAAVSDRSST